MPRKGQVRLSATRMSAMRAARWLDSFFYEQPSWAVTLSAAFRKAAARKRSTSRFTMLIDVTIARQFAASRDAAVTSRTALPDVLDMMNACRGRRGRPRLSRRQQEERENGNVEHLDERHRQRVAREAKYNRALDRWFEEHGSLMGSATLDGEAFRTFPKK